MRIRLHFGDRHYEWRELAPTVLNSATTWAHHGLAVAADGATVSFAQHLRSLVYVSPDGTVTGVASVPITCAHGIMPTSSQDGESFWLADTGVATDVIQGKVVRDVGKGRVVLVRRDGGVVDALEAPHHPAYARDAPFRPTSVVVDESAEGGTGDIWVADGYGQSLVHRYDRGGAYVSTLDGVSAGGRFDCPHALHIDRRRAQPELLVADRGNARVQVFDLEGRFKRAFGDDYLLAPSAFATVGELLVIGDLRARLTAVDLNDRKVLDVGDGGTVCQEAGWPNSAIEGGIEARPIVEGRFTSPHGLAVSPNGVVCVAEWRLGARMVSLAPV